MTWASSTSLLVRARAHRRTPAAVGGDRGGRRSVQSITAGAEPTAGATRLAGFTIPGLANAHSHAFHRAFAVAHAGRPGHVLDVARADVSRPPTGCSPTATTGWREPMFAEMALAGVTCVGEFHYLHHQPDGTPYADPNEMGEALARRRRRSRHPHHLARHAVPARRARPTTGYTEPTGRAAPVQPTAASGVDRAWSPRSAARRHCRRIGAADPFRARRRPRRRCETVAGWAADTGTRAPRPRVGAARRERGVPRASRSHADRGARRCRSALASGSPRCTPPTSPMPTSPRSPRPARPCAMCPTTERDLGDGIGPTRAFAAAGVPMALGSDSHAVDRPVRGSRARSNSTSACAAGSVASHTAIDLLDMATVNGHRCLGWDDAGAIAVGHRADLVSVSLGSVRTAGCSTTRMRLEADGVRGERRRRHRRGRRRPHGSSPTGDTSTSTSPPNCTPPSRS